MPRRKTAAPKDGAGGSRAHQPISLKVLAERLGLSPATVSLVMNRSPVAKSIPRHTQERVLQAARRLNYRPNFVARSLRKRRSFTVGVLVPEISEGYAALVIAGIEDLLLQEGYFYFVASHRHHLDLIEEYPKLLLERSVEGLIAVDTPWRHTLDIPVVAVSGHDRTKGVVNIVLHHERAATLALEHLYRLGHRRIALMKGQTFSSDTETRWQAITRAARQLRLAIKPGLVVQLEGEAPTPDPGYQVMQKLLVSEPNFTALFSFNDISAIGAIRALREAGLRVPEDVSVVGFDDIQSAAFQNPGLTTVRQPLRRMGEIAAATLLQRISNPGQTGLTKTIVVEPELVVRESTAKCASPAPARTAAAART